MKYPYIAGPMTGIPQFNFPAFLEAEETLRHCSFPVNPAQHDLETYPNMKAWPGYATGNPVLCPEFNLRAALQWDHDQIRDVCDSIIVLPGWKYSKGAASEVALALALHLPVFDYKTMKQIKPIIILDEHREETILEEASRLVDGDRQASYGHPLEDYTRTAAMWSAVLGVPITAEQAILCMCCVKISREVHGHKRDNLTDLSGYSRCLEKVYEEKQRRKTKG